MDILNIKNPYDRVELSSAVNKAQYIPHELEMWLPWNSEGVTTTSVFIEVEADGSLTIVDEASRKSGKKDTLELNDRDGYSLRIPYYPQYEAMIAEATQGVRAFGGSEAQAYLIELTKKINKMKNKNAATREFVRSGAIQGVIYRKDGSVSQNLFTLSGTSKTTHSFDLSAATTDVVENIIEAVEKSQEALGAYQGLASGFMLIAGKNMFRKLSRHEKVQSAFALWSSTSGFGNQGSALRDDMRDGFPLTTNVNLVSYWKGKVGATNFLDPDKAILCPIVDGLYQTRYAPGTGKDVVNTIGLPEYAAVEPLPFNKGDEVHMEMSVVSYVERPEALVEITDSSD